MLSNREKAKIRHYLSYPSWQRVVYSIQLGTPASAQSQYVLEGAFDSLTLDGEEVVRMDLCACEKIEAQLIDSVSRLKASKIGGIQTNANEGQMLRRELHQWISTLANDMGCYSNPYASGHSAVNRGVG